jgi:hypothetical protein
MSILTTTHQSRRQIAEHVVQVQNADRQASELIPKPKVFKIHEKKRREQNASKFAN